MLATWHELLDDGSLQDGTPYLAATAKPVQAHLSPATARALSLVEGDPVTVRTDRGAITVPVFITAMPDSVVWLPTRSAGSEVYRTLGVGEGAVVRLEHGRRPHDRPFAVAAHVVAGAFVAAPTHRDVWWLVIVKTVVVFAFLMVMTLFMIWAERRVVARMQQRLGPNRVGPFGLLQGLADGIKLALKEDIIPTAADKVVFIIAPIISAIPAFMAFAVIPFGPTVSIFGKHTDLQLTDLPVAVLFVLAMSSMGIYGIVLAGWSSGSTYPLLGGVRSAAQMISYEVAMGLSFVGVFLQSGSLSTSEIVAQQHRWWSS